MSNRSNWTQRFTAAWDSAPAHLKGTDRYRYAMSHMDPAFNFTHAERRSAGSGTGRSGLGSFVGLFSRAAGDKLQARAEAREAARSRRQMQALGREMRRQQAWAERMAAFKARLASLIGRKSAPAPAPWQVAAAADAARPMAFPSPADRRLMERALANPAGSDARIGTLHETSQMMDIRPLRRAQGLADGDRTGWAQDLATVTRVRQWAQRAEALNPGDAADDALTHAAVADRRAREIAARTAAALAQAPELVRDATGKAITPEAPQPGLSEAAEAAAARIARI